MHRYFARIADERMAEDDQAILVTHQPRWLSDWFWDETACHNLRQLVRGHLRGRARVHLAGLDFHISQRVPCFLNVTPTLAFRTGLLSQGVGTQSERSKTFCWSSMHSPGQD